MNSITLLIISMTVCLLAGVLKKVLIDGYENSNRSYYFNSAVLSAVAALGLFVTAETMKISIFSFLTGLLFGVVTFGQQVTNLKALEYGPLGYTTVFISLSTLITALSDPVSGNGTLSIIQVIGIILMLGCLVLSVDFKASDKKASLRWFIYCFISFLCSGSVGLLQKFHQGSAYKDELDSFLVIAFIFIAVAATVLMLLSKRTPQSDKRPITQLLPILLLIISGLCVAANNKLNLYLSGVIKSYIFFPVVNGGGVMLTILAALFIFREKPKFLQWCGLLLGVASIVFLCDPF